MTIDEYLRELKARLRVGPLRRLRILREIEAHALDAAREEEERGYAREEAERKATERLGSPEQLAARFGGGRVAPRSALIVVAALAGGAACVALLLGVALALVGGGGVRHATPLTASAVCGGKDAKRACVEAFRRSCRAGRGRIHAAIWTVGGRASARVTCSKVPRG